MKHKWIILLAVGTGMMVGMTSAAAHSYNPITWIKKPTASQQLAANSEQEKKLTVELQALLPPKTTLKEACTVYKRLEDCVASLHVAQNLKIKFNCLKWDMTAIQPMGDVKSCEAPGKAMTLPKAIRTLKPEADARAEANYAERRAREDIKDAGS